MDKFDRIYALNSMLTNARHPIAKDKIETELECSRATVERIIMEMRNYLGAPIEYSRQANGYFYNKDGNTKYELPGLWFNASELYALLVAYQLLSVAEPGLLEDHIGPLVNKIKELLEPETINEGELAKRVRILKMAARKVNPKHFSKAAMALLSRKQLDIHFRGRGSNEKTQRTISPQRLIHFRDNWYLDAWCHLRNQLRTFSLDRIERSNTSNEQAIDIPENELDSHYASSFGIFAGNPKHKAKLKFNPTAAKWVADEIWHPDQKGQRDIDGNYELEIPYSDPRELIQDILKYGPDVEVISPAVLRKEVIKKLKQAIAIYENNN